jgi:hypothetical protein
MMNARRSFPFYSNTPDNFHCYQAALRMVLEYFEPNRSYTWEELDQITGHKTPYTWPFLGLLYCQKLGLHVKTIELFDYQKFAASGYSYLVEKFGALYADTQREYSDLQEEMTNARKFIGLSDVEMRVPTDADLRSAFDAGEATICNVNARVLQKRDGYTGHFVVLTGISDDGVWLHDPGLPSMENRYCPWSVFDQAWSYPDKEARNVYFISRGAS